MANPYTGCAHSHKAALAAGNHTALGTAGSIAAPNCRLVQGRIAGGTRALLLPKLAAGRQEDMDEALAFGVVDEGVAWAFAIHTGALAVVRRKLPGIEVHKAQKVQFVVVEQGAPTPNCLMLQNPVAGARIDNKRWQRWALPNL